MIIDFSKICNTYDKSSYKKEYFSETPCPKCPARGDFILYGSYKRHVLYLVENQIYYKHIDLKRVQCNSCESTHAVMPGDIIPYKLLSLCVVIFILNTCLITKDTPVLKVAEQMAISFQCIYSCLQAFLLYKNKIHQFFKETSPADTQPETNQKSVMALIKKPYLKFQSFFTEHNRRPCFMCKFFNGVGGPAIGIYALWKEAT